MEEANNLSLSIMDGDLKGKEIFLTGENHGVKANVDLRMKFVKYFKERTDFKYYLWELPYSTAYFLNKYLQTGDEDILRDVYSNLEGTDAYNQDDYKHWQDLYQYNKSLDKERRITLIGIDIEHQSINAVKFINHCLSQALANSNCRDQENPESIRDIDRQLEVLMDLAEKENQTHGQDYSQEIKALAYKLLADLNSNKVVYQEILGDHYLSCQLVVQNLLNRYQVYEGNNFNHIRDGIMYKNFREIYAGLPKDKYFGQLGLSHIFQQSFPYVDWFAALLEKDPGFQGKILSIAYVYKDCKYLYPTQRRAYTSSIDTLDPAIEAFQDLLQGPFTIFKLNGPESPFAQDLLWPIGHKFPKKGVTTDYFHYLLVIKGSSQARPIPWDKDNDP